MQLIQISGKAGMGKDTFARELYMSLQSEGKKVLILHYADRIKEIARICYGWNGIKDDAGRKLLQDLGNNARKISEDIWIEEIHFILKLVAQNFDYVIIPDCRFKNEIEYWNKNTDYEQKVFRINRENFVSTLTEEAQKDATETGLDKYKKMINIDLPDGEEKLNEFCKEFIKEYKFV